MDHVCILNPIKPGKEADARRFYEEVEGERKPDYAASEERLGIAREAAWITPLPDGGEAFVLYIAAADFERAFATFVESQEEFDVWFKQQVLEISGLDLNNPPEGMQLPELVSLYERDGDGPAAGR